MNKLIIICLFFICTASCSERTVVCSKEEMQIVNFVREPGVLIYSLKSKDGTIYTIESNRTLGPTGIFIRAMYCNETHPENKYFIKIFNREHKIIKRS